MLYDYASTRLAAVKHKVVNKWGEQMEQDWISESALDGTNALNNEYCEASNLALLYKFLRLTDSTCNLATKLLRLCAVV